MTITLPDSDVLDALDFDHSHLLCRIWLQDVRWYRFHDNHKAHTADMVVLMSCGHRVGTCVSAIRYEQNDGSWAWRRTCNASVYGLSCELLK